jgi:hypothetical protein
MARTALSERQLAELELRRVRLLNRGGSTSYPPGERRRYQFQVIAHRDRIALAHLQAAIAAVGADASDLELVEPFSFRR